MFQNTQDNTEVILLNEEPQDHERTSIQQSPSLLNYQDAQDPLEGFEEMFPPWVVEPQNSSMQLKIRSTLKRKHKKRSFLKHFPNPHQSFVLKSIPTKGCRRLIKIEIIDMEQRVPREPEEGKPLLCAQYVVSDDVDHIMDQTESVINNISKKLSGYSYSF